MNVDRLLRVRDGIEAEPERLEMFEDFVTPRFNDQGALVGCDLCIAARAALDAGFIELRSTPRPGLPGTFYDVTSAGTAHATFMLQLGAAALELDDVKADRLFFVDEWPKGYASSYLQSKHRTARAAITVRRIARFIDTEGQE